MVGNGRSSSLAAASLASKIQKTPYNPRTKAITPYHPLLNKPPNQRIQTHEENATYPHKSRIFLLLTHSRRLSSFQSQNKMQMVIYGISSINSYEPPHLQLSLAILLSRRFDSMIEGWIEVFDPIISKVESRVMEALGCTVLKVDEQGRREGERPMLFFMPHCEVELYKNLLEANWWPEWLNPMVVFGNNFERYHSFVLEFECLVVGKYSRYVLEARRFAEEVGIDTICEHFFRVFHDTSWHFFCLDVDVGMEEMMRNNEDRKSKWRTEFVVLHSALLLFIVGKI